MRALYANTLLPQTRKDCAEVTVFSSATIFWRSTFWIANKQPISSLVASQGRHLVLRHARCRLYYTHLWQMLNSRRKKQKEPFSMVRSHACFQAVKWWLPSMQTRQNWLGSNNLVLSLLYVGLDSRILSITNVLIWNLGFGYPHENSQ